MAVDHNNPQSRNEEILIATIDGTEYDKIPQSRIEELLLELKEVIEEGGGTSDYENLSNRPQVNGVTLTGDKSGADLGLVDAEEGKALSTNDYDDTEKAAVAAATSAISAIKDGTDIDSFGDVEVALLDKADISDLGTAAAKDSTNAVTSGSTDLVESGAVKEAIDAAVSSAYHHAGTKTVAQLTHDLLVAANEGNVYNITDSGTTTSDFIEGIGKTIDEGSNVGICKVGNEYMFDLLSGFIDTTNFIQKSQTSGLLKNDGTVNDEIEGDVDQLNTAINGITNGESINNFAGVETALEDKAEQSEVDDIAENTESETATVSGNPISLSDALATDAISVVAEIEPSQDLHGYDKPWSGGAGKNKLPLVLADIKRINARGTWSGNVYSFRGIDYTVNTDSDGNVISVTADGTASQNAPFNIVDSYNISAFDGCIVNGSPAGGSASTYGFFVMDTDYHVYAFNYGEDITMTIPSGKTGSIYLQVSQGYTASNLVFLPMIRLATETDATFEPYSNVCPISGMDSVTVTTTDGTDTNTATASLGTTIYGGSVDLTEGSGSVTMASVDLGTLTWIYDATNVRFYSDVVDNAVALSDGLCTAYPVIQTADFTQPNSLFISGTKRINITDTIYTDATSFKTWLTDNNIKLVYPLATPFTLSLTPATLAMLEGENTVSTDAEEVSVEYVKNTLAGRVKHLEDESGVIDYSTEEQKTGQKWIDGKDIYFKTIEFDGELTLAPQTWTSIDVSGASISTIINAFGVDGNGTYFNFNATPNTSNTGNIGFLQTRNVDMKITKSVIYYTKTT